MFVRPRGNPPVAYRGAFAYVTGVLPDGEHIPLCRLRYGGSAHSFGFAIYSASRDRYEDSALLTGFPTVTPQEALDTACTIHLAGLGHEPDPLPGTQHRRTYKAIHLASRSSHSARHKPLSSTACWKRSTSLPTQG
jgi:hypothetical protein